MKRVITFVFLCLLVSPNLRSETPGTMAQEANQAYRAGNYQQAIGQWNGLLSLGLRNGKLYYNMASAYWRLGLPGQAYLYLLKAKQLAPRDGDIQKNLRFVESKLGKNQEAPSEGPLAYLSSIPWWRLALNYYEATIFFALGSLLFFGYLILRKTKGRAPRIFPTVLFGFILLVSGVLFSTRAFQHFFSDRGIILVTEAPLLEAPTQDGGSSAKLAEGSSVQVLKRQGKFRLVKTHEGKEGWVTAAHVGEI